jgi:Skp family chaperone for outer membrane proteins
MPITRSEAVEIAFRTFDLQTNFPGYDQSYVQKSWQKLREAYQRWIQEDSWDNEASDRLLDEVQRFFLSDDSSENKQVKEALEQRAWKLRRDLPDFSNISDLQRLNGDRNTLEGWGKLLRQATILKKFSEAGVVLNPPLPDNYSASLDQFSKVLESTEMIDRAVRNSQFDPKAREQLVRLAQSVIILPEDVTARITAIEADLEQRQHVKLKSFIEEFKGKFEPFIYGGVGAPDKIRKALEDFRGQLNPSSQNEPALVETLNKWVGLALESLPRAVASLGSLRQALDQLRFAPESSVAATFKEIEGSIFEIYKELKSLQEAWPAEAGAAPHLDEFNAFATDLETFWNGRYDVLLSQLSELTTALKSRPQVDEVRLAEAEKLVFALKECLNQFEDTRAKNKRANLEPHLEALGAAWDRYYEQFGLIDHDALSQDVITTLLQQARVLHDEEHSIQALSLVVAADTVLQKMHTTPTSEQRTALSEETEPILSTLREKPKDEKLIVKLLQTFLDDPESKSVLLRWLGEPAPSDKIKQLATETQQTELRPTIIEEIGKALSSLLKQKVRWDELHTQLLQVINKEIEKHETYVIEAASKQIVNWLAVQERNGSKRHLDLERARELIGRLLLMPRAGRTDSEVRHVLRQKMQTFGADLAQEDASDGRIIEGIHLYYILRAILAWDED